MKKQMYALLGMATWKLAKTYGRRRLRSAGRSLAPRSAR
jgi:hypothetical protein